LLNNLIFKQFKQLKFNHLKVVPDTDLGYDSLGRIDNYRFYFEEEYKVPGKGGIVDDEGWHWPESVKLEIIEIIGGGGFAFVEHAKGSNGKEFAVKVMREFDIYERPFRNDAVFRFYHEATIMSNLSHPCIPKIYDVLEYQGQPAIVMELIRGTNLFKLNKGVKLNAGELKVLWDKVVPVLDYIHSRGVVHNDISPGNIMLTHLGEIKLIDFGISDSPMNGKRVIVDITWGTKEFMSPEQVRTPKQVDYRTDYYSLARTFLYLLTGNSPKKNGWAKGENGLSEYCTAPDGVFRNDICECAENFESCPEDWKQFLKPYLAKDPNQRPQKLSKWG